MALATVQPLTAWLDIYEATSASIVASAEQPNATVSELQLAPDTERQKDRRFTLSAVELQPVTTFSHMQTSFLHQNPPCECPQFTSHHNERTCMWN